MHVFLFLSPFGGGWGQYRKTKGAMVVALILNGILQSLVRLFPKLWDEHIHPEGSKAMTGHGGGGGGGGGILKN